jgi:hypothetical protein
MSDGTRYRARYIAHVSANMRLPRPKPFAARMFMREDDIGAEEARGRRCGEIGSGDIGMGNMARGRRGRFLLYNGGSWALAPVNAGTDGHVAMHDEMLHCVAWESWAPLASLDQR